MADIRVITLDLDNTLWDVDSVIIRAEAQMKDWLQEHAAEVLTLYTPEQLGPLRERVLEEYSDKRHDLTFMRVQMLTELGMLAGHDAEQARNIAQQAFDVFFIGRNQVQFFEGALDMLADVSSHLPVYALTNGNADIQRAGIGHLLQGAFSSADVGVSKPHQDMFHTPLKKLGYQPEQAIHIGDNLVDDIHGAKQSGLYSIWVNLKNAVLAETDPLPDREVQHLDQVLSAVHSIID